MFAVFVRRRHVSVALILFALAGIKDADAGNNKQSPQPAAPKSHPMAPKEQDNRIEANFHGSPIPNPFDGRIEPPSFHSSPIPRYQDYRIEAGYFSSPIKSTPTERLANKPIPGIYDYSVPSGPRVYKPAGPPVPLPGTPISGIYDYSVPIGPRDYKPAGSPVPLPGTPIPGIYDYSVPIGPPTLWYVLKSPFEPVVKTGRRVYRPAGPVTPIPDPGPTLYSYPVPRLGD